MDRANRKTGIDIIGSVPWGTHLCHFYQTKEDLIDILVPYFKAGLENNEFCMWITSEPLKAKEAKAVLNKELRDLDNYIKNGQIEILDCQDWYTKFGKFDAEKVLQGWGEKEKEALQKGFAGLRVTGNTFWLTKQDWKNFADYEAIVRNVISKYQIIAICSYSLNKYRASEVIDVVANHQVAIIKRDGKWISIESSERKKVADALKESERKIRALLDQTFQFIGLMTAEGVLIEANRTALDFAGIAESAVLNKPFWETPWWTHSAELQNKLREAIKKVALGEFVRFEATHIAKDKSLHYIDFSLKPVKDEYGKIIFMIPEGRDITERKKAENALSESEIRYRGVFDSIRDALMLFDAQTKRFIDCNKETLRLYGYTKEEFLKLTVLDISAEVDKSKYALEELISEGHIYQSMRYQKKKDGTVFPAEITAGSFRLKDRWVIIGSVRDITERVRIERELHISAKMSALGRFVAGATHEINNPLGIISGNTQYLLKKFGRFKFSELKPKDFKEIIDCLKLVNAHCERCSKITKNLLQFAREEKLNKHPSDINKCIKNVSSLLEHQLRLSNIKLVKKLDSNLPKAKVDVDKLKQVFMNLIINAQLAMPKGGKLFITSRIFDGTIDIEFSDTGVGITPANQDKLFEPFFTTREVGEGTGLGLATSYAIIRKHRGNIKIDSKPNQGTKVIISLPIPKI